MIDHYFVKPQTRDRIRACWLGEPIERYVAWLHEQGYAARNVLARVPIVMRFADHAKARGAQTLADLPDHVRSFVEQWLRERGSRCRDERARRSVGSCARNPIEQMLSLVLPGFVGTGRRRHPDPFVAQAPGFFDYTALGHRWRFWEEWNRMG